MLMFNTGLMAKMDDGHLIMALECEPMIMRTPIELELMKRCERLTEELAERPALELIEACVSEAIAQYPDDDFLEKLADRIFELGQNVRGNNKAEARAIAKELTELGQTVSNAASYGRTELNKIFN